MKTYQKETMNTYSQIANAFAIKNNNITTMDKYHNKFQEYLPTGQVYDLGCGTGRDTNAFKQMGYDVCGYDLSESMIEVAKQSYPDCDFQKADILSDFFNVYNTDGVWATASLLHFTKDDFLKALHTIHYMLRDNGIFYLSMKLNYLIEEEVVDGRYFRYYTVSELTTYLEEQGFEILYFDKVDNTPFGNFFARKIPLKS